MFGHIAYASKTVFFGASRVTISIASDSYAPIIFQITLSNSDVVSEGWNTSGSDRPHFATSAFYSDYSCVLSEHDHTYTVARVMQCNTTFMYTDMNIARIHGVNMNEGHASVHRGFSHICNRRAPVHS